MDTKTIVIIGGTGFLGRYVVRRLAKAGYVLRVISRRPDLALHLKTAGNVGQVVLESGDITNPDSLKDKFEGCFAVINLAGILAPSGRQKFTAVHTRGPEKLAQMAKTARAEKFIHVSALGADKAFGSRYAASKISGEKAVMAAFPDATILRPSVIFGAEDNFFNLFARMASLSPVLPLIAGGKTRFQPVYVDDVAKAIEVCLTRADVRGQTYELGGPRAYSFKELLEYILRTIGKHCRLVNVPLGMATVMGTFGELLPRPLITRDQVTLLKHDNVITPNAKTFSNLGIRPTPIEEIAPHTLARFHKDIPLAA